MGNLGRIKRIYKKEDRLSRFDGFDENLYRTSPKKRPRNKLTNTENNFKNDKIIRNVQPMKIASEELGKRFRALRKQRRLTLARMAKMTRKSVSLLSQIETGRVNPSFSSMQSIADALGAPLSQLIPQDESVIGNDHALMKLRDRKVLTTRGGVEHQLLSHSLSPSFEFVINVLPPGSSTGRDLYTHDGVECGILLEGKLEVQIGKKIYCMKPGDSITLNSSIPHRLANCGTKKAMAVWVNSIPFIFSTR
jgi:transcriptional regulator with XRE-family HTH domain